MTSRNIGDVLNTYLFKKVFQKDIINNREILNLGMPRVYSFIGSVLDNSAVRNLTIMGSGFKHKSSRMVVKPRKVVACRGPLTRKKLLEMGVEAPEVYGDPAILLPTFYNPSVDGKYEIGVIPHYADKSLGIIRKVGECPEIKVIDVFSDMGSFVADIKSCKFTVSSSLHGIILSHAYGVPSAWMKPSDNVAGGSFKFEDYFQSVNANCTPAPLDSINKLDTLERCATLPPIEPLAKTLLHHLRNS